jgi:hypothetical protein
VYHSNTVDLKHQNKTSKQSSKVPPHPQLSRNRRKQSELLMSGRAGSRLHRSRPVGSGDISAIPPLESPFPSVSRAAEHANGAQATAKFLYESATGTMLLPTRLTAAAINAGDTEPSGYTQRVINGNVDQYLGTIAILMGGGMTPNTLDHMARMSWQFKTLVLGAIQIAKKKDYMDTYRWPDIARYRIRLELIKYISLLQQTQKKLLPRSQRR